MELQNATEYPQVPKLSLYTLTHVTGRCHLQSSPLPSLYYGSSVFATTGSRDEAEFLELRVGRSAIMPEFRGKGKSRPRTGHEGHSSTLSLVSAPDEGVQRHTPAALAVLTVQKAGWAQGQCRRLRKFLPQPGLDPRTVQAVASRYTDCAIPVRPEFQGNPGRAFVADIAFPETRSNFNGPNQASKEGGGPQPCC